MHTLIAVNPDIATATRVEWGQQIAGLMGISPPHYERILDYVDKYANGNGEQHTYVYALVKKDTTYAAAILEVTHARPNAIEPWLKLLSIHLAPRFDLDATEQLDAELVNEIAVLLGLALTESVRLTFKDHPSTKLKVYGRTDFFMGFFEHIIAGLGNVLQPNGLDVCKQGRWLVFTKR